MPNSILSVFVVLLFSNVAIDWHAAGFKSGALTMCTQLPNTLTREHKDNFAELSAALHLASEKQLEHTSVFLDGIMSFLSSLEREGALVYRDAEGSVMARLTEEQCQAHAAGAQKLLSQLD